MLSVSLLATVKPKKQSCGASDDVCRRISVSEGMEDVYIDHPGIFKA